MSRTIRTTRLALAALAAAVGISAAGGAIGVTAASAAAPRTVKAGATGSSKLDDICGQMAKLINEEITAGNNAEANGDFGGANAWWNQANDHIRRSQEAGCVMTIVAPKHRFYGVFTSGTVSKDGTAKSRGSQSKQRKRVSGTATGSGAGYWTQSQCDDFARFINEALDKSDQAARDGDPDLAKGWRDHANELIRAGQAGGCSFSAAIISRANGTSTASPAGQDASRG